MDGLILFDHFCLVASKQSDLSAWEEKVSSPDPKLFNLEKQITQKKMTVSSYDDTSTVR